VTTSSSRVPLGIAAQPVAAVEWVDRERLRSNSYNPNTVFTPEMRLLKISILEDGWTQPIVVRALESGDFEVVDGFHRWTLSADPDVYALTDGYVPVVRLRASVDASHQRLSTVRHNRARGTHAVVKMADLVTELDAAGLPPAEIGRRLGMDPEEVDRLLQRGRMTDRHGDQDFNRGWVPV
jgi:ParB-like chromosome segregation protein Spo0J